MKVATLLVTERGFWRAHIFVVALLAMTLPACLSDNGAGQGNGTSRSPFPTSHFDIVTFPGGTGAEAAGLIPVGCIPSPDEKALIDQCFQLVNAYRVAQGKAALMYDPDLEQLAEGHAHHLKIHQPYSLTDTPLPLEPLQVSTLAARATLLGTTANLQNLGPDYLTPQGVLEWWKMSPTRNQKVLDDGSKRMGIGHYAGGAWVLVLGP